MMINLAIVGNSITGSYGEKSFGCSFSKEKYAEMQRLMELSLECNTMTELQGVLDSFELLTKENRKEVIETKNPHIYVNNFTGKYYLKTSGGKVSNIPMPVSLVERINESFDKGVDFLPLVKMWTRLLRNKKAKNSGFMSRVINYINMTWTNPKEVSRLMNEQGLSHDKAMELATVYQVKITQEGLLGCYKVSSEILHRYEASEDGQYAVEKPRYSRTFNPDTGEITSEGLPEFVEDRVFEPACMGQSGDAFYCGDKLGHIIRVGEVHYLDSWDKVNCDDNVSCTLGLHIGHIDFIKGYSGEIHNVFVDPMDLGAVTNDGTGALRVIRYFVHSSLVGLNKNIYHSSTYASLTDQAWEKMRDEIIASHGELLISDRDRVSEEVEQLKSL